MLEGDDTGEEWWESAWKKREHKAAMAVEQAEWEKGSTEARGMASANEQQVSANDCCHRPTKGLDDEV